MLESYKVEVKQKLISRDKEGHFIQIKGIIHQEDITFLNIHAPKSSVTSFIKQILLTRQNATY